ncbi:MAG: hypothetical protein ACD_19C00198G0002 [uncultured bacterium]|nr:MAG: hypothetical protein ACD_19C00198G0002 [uncultured bacterium]
MKKARILLTGGSGFIGRNIVEQLNNTYNFVIPTHKSLELLNTESVEKFFRQKGAFDVVVHCAFIGGPRNSSDTDETLKNNLRIFLNIIRNKKQFGKLINLGSGAEYGKQRPIIRISERDFDKVIPAATDYYGFGKYSIAKYIENSDNLVNLRLFGVYGKYEDFSLRFISNAICNSLLGLPIKISRNVLFDYLYINDFVKILEYFLTNKTRYKSYNVGRGVSIDLVTISDKINKIAPHKSPIEITSRGLANEYTCNNKGLMNEIANFEFTDFNKSLEELYKWYLTRVDKLRKKDFLEDHFN